MHNIRRMTLSFFHNLPDFMKPTRYGERTFSTCPQSRHRIGWPYRSLTTGSLSGTSNLCLWSRVVMNNVFDPRRALLQPLRILFFGLRWSVLSLRKRMPPIVSFGTSRWVVWDRSGLIVEMRTGLIVSDRLFLLCEWFQEVSDWFPWGHLRTCTTHSGVKKADDWSWPRDNLD
jgi:hypothetical protein